MAKRRRHRKNRRQRRGRNLVYHLSSNTIQRYVEDEDAYEQRKAKQKEYRQKIEAMERDILSRAVFVTHALDLNKEGNLNRLRMVMEQSYGLVQKCEITSYNSSKKNNRNKRRSGPVDTTTRAPPARVIFHRAASAEKIFGGMSLLQAAQKNEAVEVKCSLVGYKGFFVVKPSQKFNGMVEDEITGSKEVNMPTQRFSMGYWFPAGEDACDIIPGLLDGQSLQNEWLEELTTDLQPTLKVDLENMLIILDFSHCNPTKNISSSNHRDLMSFLSDVLTETEEQCIVSFRFKDLVGSIEMCSISDGAGAVDLIFSLKQPPKLFSVRTDEIREYKTRMTDLEGIQGTYFGTCLSYRLRVTDTTMDKVFLNRKALEKLHRYGVLNAEIDSTMQAIPISLTKLPVNDREKVEAFLAETSANNMRLGLQMRAILDSAKCCWYHALNNSLNLQSGKQMNIFDLVNDGIPSLVEQVLGHLHDMHGQTRYPALLFQTLYEDELDQYPDGYDRQNIPDFCIELPRVMLTPCRVCVTGFQIEMSNRIIRKFVQDHNYSPAAFLRVTVADENGDKLFADELTDWRLSCPDLEKNGPAALRIYILCLKGLSLNGKMYEFLAYSSSQLKEASFWMVCPQHGWTIQRMRDSMGDFSMCKTPSKYAARIGQCFSTTLVTAGKEMSQNLSTSLNLRVNDNYPDILSNDLDTGDELCHSDGAGLIRKDVLMKILKGLPIDIKSTEDISTIQIRYGGAKGVLTAWNFQDVPNPNCLNYDICLRPSMVKFQAAYSDLEVITIGKQIGYYLNRNVILLLVHHNVEEQIFIDMQTEMFQKLNEMLTDADLALQMVTLLGGFDGSLVSTLKNMLLMGLKPTQDPFLFSCLHSLRAHHLMNLRKKARIFVEKGAVLIGAIDELGLLPEGHVFIHVQKSDSDENDGYEPIVGPVMVTKHPVMHPGDVRMLIAVDLEELRGHRNVILFSQFGARPEPDKMAGSDLDGDQFAVTWDERLFLQNGNAKPMDYSPTKKAEETNEVNDYHLVKHFINHARNDNLGRIAMLWLDHAVGKNDAGCQECIELAKLHSTAVDFPKSGIPAVIHKELIIKRSQPRAHWRELKGRESFHCESILGKLYDSVIAEVRSKNKLEMYCKAMAGRKCDKNGQILIYGDAFKIEEWKRKLFDTKNLSAELVPIEDERLQVFANDQRDMYERQVYEVMNKYKVKSEGEIITGCILKYHKLQKRRRHDVAEEIRRQIREIKLGFREEFFRAVFLCSLQGLSVLESDSYDVSAHEVKDEDLQWAEEVLTRKGGNTNSGSSGVEGLSEKSIKSYGQALATAYYAASYSPEMHWRSRDYHCVLFSFPWVVAVDVLASAIIRYY